MLLCFSTEKPNYQLSGCVPRWPICLAVGNYGFSQCFSLLKPALLLLIRLLRSVTIHNCVTLPKISCHSNHMHFSSRPQSKKLQLKHRAKTKRSVRVHENIPVIFAYTLHVLGMHINTVRYDLYIRNKPLICFSDKRTHALKSSSSSVLCFSMWRMRSCLEFPAIIWCSTWTAFSTSMDNSFLLSFTHSHTHLQCSWRSYELLACPFEATWGCPRKVWHVGRNSQGSTCQPYD